MSVPVPVVDPTSTTWFDSLKAQTRHILLLLVGSLVTAALIWASQNGDTILAALNIPPAVWPFATTIIAGIVLRLTAITKQYGLWANPDGAAAAISASPDAGASGGHEAPVVLAPTGTRDDTTPPEDVAPVGDDAHEDPPVDGVDVPAPDPAVPADGALSD